MQQPKLMKKLILMMAVALMSAMQVNAQEKVSEKELVGAWMMDSMLYDNGKTIAFGLKQGYRQFKYYGPKGEYAAAGISLRMKGRVLIGLEITPQEYGEYTFKDGWYSEMGRKATNDGLNLTDKNTFKGRWQNHLDVWKRAPLSDKTVKYIVDCCKTKKMPTDIEQDILKEMFSE